MRITPNSTQAIFAIDDRGDDLLKVDLLSIGFGEIATIVGTDTGDVLVGTQQRDVIAGRGGADTISGNGGDDLICGNSGGDMIDGGDGDDRISGGPGDDTILARGGDDFVHGNTGDDTIRGGEGDDTIRGAVAPATITSEDDPVTTPSTVKTAWTTAAAGLVEISSSAASRGARQNRDSHSGLSGDFVLTSRQRRKRNVDRSAGLCGHEPPAGGGVVGQVLVVEVGGGRLVYGVGVEGMCLGFRWLRPGLVRAAQTARIRVCILRDKSLGD